MYMEEVGMPSFVPSPFAELLRLPFQTLGLFSFLSLGCRICTYFSICYIVNESCAFLFLLDQ